MFIVLLTILTCKHVCNHEHMMVTHIPLDVVIRQWFQCLTCNIPYLSFLNLLFFKCRLRWCFWLFFSFHCVSFFLFLWGFSSFGVFPFCYTNLSLFASYFKIGNSYSSSFGSLTFLGYFLCEVSINEYWSAMFIPIDIMLCVINRCCSCGFSAQLSIDCHRELVASCSREYGWTYISLWHNDFVFMPNIPL